MAKKLRGIFPSRAVDPNPVISKKINCGALIYCSKTNRYLFLLRAKGRYEGVWGIVGGKVNADETLLNGLIREIREELGGEINGAKYNRIDEYHSRHNGFTYYTFLVKVEEEFIPELNEEHIGYCWVDLDHIPKPMHPGLAMTVNSSLQRKNLLALQNTPESTLLI